MKEKYSFALSGSVFVIRFFYPWHVFHIVLLILRTQSQRTNTRHLNAFSGFSQQEKKSFSFSFGSVFHWFPWLVDACSMLEYSPRLSIWFVFFSFFSFIPELNFGYIIFSVRISFFFSLHYYLMRLVMWRHKWSVTQFIERKHTKQNHFNGLKCIIIIWICLNSSIWSTHYCNIDRFTIFS